MIECSAQSPCRRLMWPVLGLLVCAAMAAQAQPVPCSQIPAAEREQALRAGVCVDRPPRVELPAARTLQTPVLPAQPQPRADTFDRPGSEIVHIPDLVGRRFDDAVKQLQGVAAAVRENRPSTRPAGEVIEQSPRDARTPRPARVRLVVSDGSLVTVPSLRSQPVAAALARLQRLDLRGEVSERPTRLAAGTVVDQKPEPGAEVPRGTAVSVVVGVPLASPTRVPEVPATPPSRSPPLVEAEPPPRTVRVGNYIGAAVSLAAPELARRGLNPQVLWRPSTRPEGEVIDQSPRETEVARGSAVTLVGSDGSLVVVPPLQGDRAEAATAKLRAAGLQVRAAERTSQAEPGTVIDQKPGAGAEVARGSTVGILVAMPPPQPPAPELVEVPLYVGWTLAEASADADGRRLRPEAERKASSAPSGRVLAQEPLPSAVPPGSRLVLVVSDGSLVRVPPLRRLSLAQAQRVLQDVDLVAQARRRESAVAPGTVLDQEPRAGSERPRGSRVTLWVAAAAPPPPPPPPPPAQRVPSPPTVPAAIAEPPASPPLAPASAPFAAAEPPAVASAPAPAPPAPPEPPPVEPPPVRTPTAEPPALAPAREPPVPPPQAVPTPKTVPGLSPWWVAAVALPMAGAAGWVGWRLRGRVKPRAPIRPTVAAHWTGAAERPQLATHDGPALHVRIEVSAPRPAHAPTAQISQEEPDE